MQNKHSKKQTLWDLRIVYKSLVQSVVDKKHIYTQKYTFGKHKAEKNTSRMLKKVQN